MENQRKTIAYLNFKIISLAVHLKLRTYRLRNHYTHRHTAAHSKTTGPRKQHTTRTSCLSSSELNKASKIPSIETSLELLSMHVFNRYQLCMKNEKQCRYQRRLVTLSPNEKAM